MTRMSTLLKFALVIAAVAFIGCQDRSNIMEPQQTTLGPMALPSGVTIDSANFVVFVNFPGGQTVNVHRITADWAENTVTWNSFGEQFDAPIVNSFVPTTMGFYSIDVTSLVQGWINGTYPNYGLLLEEGLLPLTAYTTSEWPYTNLYRPLLRICYTTPGGPVCETFQRGVNGTVNDAYIWEANPNTNYGASDQAYTGAANDLNKQSLFRFDLPVVLLAAIGDFVWFDDNRDGIQDLGEPGVPGVTVELMDCAGHVLATDVTDADGLYLFSGLTPGDYNIHFVFPAGFSISPQDTPPNDALDSDADVTTGLTICTTLDGGETDLTWDMGIFLPDEHCTRTIGYWKTHDGSGPQADVVTALLPQWLGTAGGTKSINVTNTTISHRILELTDAYYGPASNGISKLYAQLLGAKLNAANDADVSLIAATMAASDVFLATHNWLDWAGLTNAQKVLVNGWARTLDNYNNGLIGPIHCD